MFHYARKAVAVGFLVFLGLWTVETIRALTLPYPPPLPDFGTSSGGDYFSGRSGNFANNLKQIGLIETPLPQVLDNPEADKIRIIEKTASLTAGTAAFTADEAQVRSALADYQGTIFSEMDTGIEPRRRLMLEIGVHPDKFDGLLDRLRHIGALSSISVEQKDRTGEFRKLHAQRQALKKYLESILKLRGGGKPSIDESLKLEQKIQDIEKELQTLNVQFGDLLGKESFYHIHLTLVEYQPGGKHDLTYSVPHRIFHAFLWAVAWWFACALAGGVMLGTALSVGVLRR